jgi:hypothetical protein
MDRLVRELLKMDLGTQMLKKLFWASFIHGFIMDFSGALKPKSTIFTKTGLQTDLVNLST